MGEEGKSTPLKMEPGSVPQAVALTEREIALADLISKSLAAAFDQKLESVRGEMHGYVQRANQVVQEMSQQQAVLTETRVREAAEQTLPAVAAVAQRVAADVLQQHSQPVIQAAQAADAAAARAAAAAGYVERAASSVAAGLQNPPPPPPAPQVHMMPVEAVAQTYSINLPTMLPGIPTFDGGDPLREGITADQLMLHLETVRKLHPPLTDGQLILITAGRFRKDGYAYHWWQSVLVTADAEFPFPTWASFKRAFIDAMRGPDPATAVRLELNGLRMAGTDLNSYVARFRSLYLRLQSLGSPMSEGDAVHKFACGLAPRLRTSCPLEDHVSLTTAIAKVTRKHNSRELFNMFPGDRSVGRRQGSAGLHALEAGEDDVVEGEETEYDDEYAELSAMMGGRGRGRGRSSSRGRGRHSQGGRRGGGRSGGKAPGKSRLTAEQRARFVAGQCLHCGSADHWASDCPMKPAGQENS